MSVVEIFERGEVDVACFDHRAHVRVAWHYLEALPLLEALPRFCDALERLVRRCGAEAKYNATVSVAFLLLIRDRMRQGESWTDFAARESAFIDQGLAPLRAYYDERALARPDARARFELPQLSRDL